MLKYAYKSNPAKSVKVYGRSMRISSKSSVIVCRKITGMSIDKGRDFLLRLSRHKDSINGKYYDNVTNSLIMLLKSAEGNAENKGLDPNKLFIHASAHQGFSFWRPRAWKMRRQKRKMTNIQFILEER